MSNASTLQTLASWQHFHRALMHEGLQEISVRQMAILLAVYLSQEPQTVKQLAEHLRISKPAVCRALDMLSQQGLLKRKTDARDRRVVVVQRTIKGSVLLSDIAALLQESFSPAAQPTLAKIPS